MESDKRYFVEGLFIIALSFAIAMTFVWLSRSGNKDDVLYRIRFSESVTGMALGDAVKFRGVDVGTVKSLTIDPEDPRKVLVLVALRSDTPVRTDTRAILKLKGITGNVYIELDGAGVKTASLAEATPKGQVPEIVAVKSELTNALEALPKVIEKFSKIEDKTTKILNDSQKVISDVGETAAKIKENPTLLLRAPKPKPAPEPKPGTPDPSRVGSGS